MGEIALRQRPLRNSGGIRLRRRYLARRLEILRAAGREFRMRGFAETGMRDIAAAASLSPANLYNYFKGKHEILFFCQDNSLDRMIAALEKARRLRTSTAARLRMVIVSHLRCLLDEVEGSAAHFLTSALPSRLHKHLVAKRDRYEAGVRNLIAAGVRSGEFVASDPALTARALLGSLNWSVQWFSPEGPLTAAEIAERFGDYLIRGLLAKPDALQRPVSARSPERSTRESAFQSMKRQRAAARVFRRTV
ncbi:MAG TPA: TetR/AcrR family transcriptional regulator [Candidatus Acidoferrum sp.]|nr:TetR/AcrR family transcriptional regulator [Candidatus Acidoferrum sp.]